MPISQNNANLLSNLSSINSEFKSDSWQLGDRAVQRVGFGTKRLAGSTNGGRDVEDRAVALLRRAVELGVNHVDTADFYPSHSTGDTRDFTSLGWANQVIRRALAPYSDELVMATKVGPTETGLARPDELRALVELNLRDLGLETLDVVYLRQQGLDSVAEHFGALAEMQGKGMIRQLALSNVRLEHLAEAQRIAPVVAVQNRYGVGFGRVNDEMIRVCGDQGIAFVPFFAVAAAGREAGGVASSDVVDTVAGELGAAPAQVRIAWTLSRGRHVLAIPGTSSEDHLAENVAAGAIQLSPAQISALDAIQSEG